MRGGKKQFQVCAFQLMQTEGSYFSTQVVVAFECYTRVSDLAPALGPLGFGEGKVGIWSLMCLILRRVSQPCNVHPLHISVAPLNAVTRAWRKRTLGDGFKLH